MRNSRRLLLSIHDVSPRFSAPVETLAGILAEEVGAGRFAMLVVPDFWNEAPLLADRAFVARLRSWAALGVEMFVHGWCHRDESRHRGAIARVKARHMTAGEGEFLGLSREEAVARMRRGRDVVEQAIGGPVAGFIAPAWLYGPGAIEAAGALGFDLAEDHMKVWSPARSRVLARGPVVTWASRTPMRAASSIAFAALARRTLGPMATVRIALHPGDVSDPRLIESARRTIRRLGRGRAIARYRDLIDAGGENPRHL